LLQTPIHVQSDAQLITPPTVAAAASSASGGPQNNISSDKQIPTTPQVFEREEDEMEEQAEAAPSASQVSATTDEMQEIFAQLDEGMEEMDKNFHISEVKRDTGAASNER
jgi:hypothetical protein